MDKKVVKGLQIKGPRKVEDGRTEQVHPHLQALALLKDHQGPLSLAETVR
jgi:hypothetical protein